MNQSTGSTPNLSVMVSLMAVGIAALAYWKTADSTDRVIDAENTVESKELSSALKPSESLPNQKLTQNVGSTQLEVASKQVSLETSTLFPKSPINIDKNEMESEAFRAANRLMAKTAARRSSFSRSWNTTRRRSTSE